MKQSDKTVLLECNGTPKYMTFEDIQNTLEKDIFLFSSSIVSVADAQEITSESFVKLHIAGLEKIEEPKTLQKVKAFLLVCAKNMCIDLIRSQRAREKKSEKYFHETDPEPTQIAPYKDTGIEIPPKIQQIINNLPKRLREALQCSYHHETDDEIALRLGGIQPNTVKRYRTKALRTIRKELGMQVK